MQDDQFEQTDSLKDFALNRRDGLALSEATKVVLNQDARLAVHSITTLNSESGFSIQASSSAFASKTTDNSSVCIQSIGAVIAAFSERLSSKHDEFATNPKAFLSTLSRDVEEAKSNVMNFSIECIAASSCRLLGLVKEMETRSDSAIKGVNDVQQSTIKTINDRSSMVQALLEGHASLPQDVNQIIEDTNPALARLKNITKETIHHIERLAASACDGNRYLVAQCVADIRDNANACEANITKAKDDALHELDQNWMRYNTDET